VKKSVVKLTISSTIMILILSLIACTIIPVKCELAWIIALLSAAISFGSLSSLISARKLYFLSGATPHSAFMAFILALILEEETGMSSFLYAIIINTIALLITGYYINKGRNPDRITAVYVASSSSLSVLLLYYLVTNYPTTTEITGLLIGDPLLISRNELIIASIIASATLLFTLYTYKEQVMLGVDRDSTIIAGIKPRFYDISLYSGLAVTTIVMIKIVGFIVTHVLLLLPSAIATLISKRAIEVLIFSLSISIVSVILGLSISIKINQSPSGIAGILLLLTYIVASLYKKR